MRKLPVCVGLIFVYSTLGAIAVSRVATTSAQFLKIGIGARETGLGEAVVAGVSGDVSAIYWNVGAMSRAHLNKFVATHTDWFMDTRLDFVGVLVPIRRVGVIGLALTAFNAGEFEQTTLDEQEGTGVKFTAGAYALHIAFGRNLTDRFSFGIGAKYITENIWLMRASSFAIDVGMLYDLTRNCKLGISLSNFGGSMRLWGENTRILYPITEWQQELGTGVLGDLRTESWALPLRFQVGLNWNFMLTPSTKWTVEVDAVHPNDNYEYINVGLEVSFLNMLFVRLGKKDIGGKVSDERFSMGIGLKLRPAAIKVPLTLDYTYTDYRYLGRVQRIGVRFGW